MIELKNVSKILDHQTVLSNVNLVLKSGNIYGFVGRNGSGKSMLFRAISGLILPTEGTIIIDGKDLKTNINVNEIGVMIEKPKFLYNLSGFENLQMLAAINKKVDDEHLIEILKKLHLEDVKDKKYGKYSLGMKQKLGIAQAIMENQKIIILDEPFNGLDDSSVDSLRKLLLELKDEGKLVLIATHLKEDIELLCDEVFRMDAGKIVIK